VQQNVPLADVGNKRAPVGGSHFQPLATNLAGLGLDSGGAGSASGGAGGSGPQILTGDAALASLGVNTAAPASRGRQVSAHWAQTRLLSLTLTPKLSKKRSGPWRLAGEQHKCRVSQYKRC
jgi:hypothetical protein